MTDKWNMIVDVALCENCQNCVLTNKDEHVEQGFPGYAAPMPKHGTDWIKISRHDRGSSHHVTANYLVTMCNHCDNAPCIAAGHGAVKKREDGIVLIDPVAAKGRKDLVEACPYGHISWNAEQDVPQNWTFDPHLLDAGWKEPRASHACPTQALRAVKCSDESMQATAAKEKLEVIDADKGTKPRVWYRNMGLVTREFLAGSVITEKRGVRDIVEGADVVLKKADTEIARTKTDMFGDFKFPNLVADGSDVTVEVTAAAGKATAKAKLTGTVVLDAIVVK